MMFFPKSLTLCLLAAATLVHLIAPSALAVEEASPAPYVDSKAIKERFDQITAEDMELLRGKNILLASRSFGLNLLKGLTALAKQDSKYDLVSSYERYNVFKEGGNLGIIPADAFDKTKFVHFLATYYPHTKRLEEVNELLVEGPHGFGKSVDVVVVYFHTATPALFETYKTTLERWQAAYPNVKFIAVTSGFMGPKFAKENEASQAFGDMVREQLKGKVPVYDLGAILSDDFRVGNQFCPEYTADPAEVHPNLPAGEEMMAKGFLLILKETFNPPQTP